MRLFLSARKIQISGRVDHRRNADLHRHGNQGGDLAFRRQDVLYTGRDRPRLLRAEIQGDFSRILLRFQDRNDRAVKSDVRVIMPPSYAKN